MADYTPQPGRGNVFRGEEGKPAAWSGKVCLPDGTMAFIDLYKATDRETGELRKDRNGDPWYNVKIKPMDGARIGTGPGADQSAPQPDSFDDPDIPF